MVMNMLFEGAEAEKLFKKMKRNQVKALSGIHQMIQTKR